MSAKTQLWTFAFIITYIKYGSAYQFNFTNPDRSEIHNIKEYCEKNICLVKCCPDKHIMVYGLEEDHNCYSSSELTKKYGVKDPDDYSDVELYNKDYESGTIKTKKSANEFKFIYHYNFTGSAQYVGSLEDSPQFKPYLLEDGKWVLRRINYWDRWIIYETGYFCIEHEVSLLEDDSLVSRTPSIVVWTISMEAEPNNIRAIFGACAMLVSCLFLALVLVVYALLPKLRNLAGVMLMACMATYFAFFMIRVIHVFANESQTLYRNGCITLSIMFYYLMLATFCWVNVMSFDIWWKFRKIRYHKSYSIKRRIAMKKFCWYCAYAWGLPVLPTLFVVVVDNLDLTHIPNFVKPHIIDNACYFEKDVQFLYVGIPTLILNCLNLIFFLMTAFNIWNVKRGVNNCKDSTNNKKDENRFWVYLKLFTVMGVSWLLEVLSDVVNAESLWWCISDVYNCLVGLLIFIIFVCKKDVIEQLYTRIWVDNAWRMRREDDSHASDEHTKSSTCQNTETSDLDNWTPSYKAMQSKSSDI